MAASNITAVQSKGLYHGLPVFPDTLKGLSAIVTGANGISGDAMVRVLAESPGRWANIFALSRRPPAIKREWGDQINVKHISLDFLNSSPEEIAQVMVENGVKADYVFFFSYIQAPPKEGGSLWSDAEEMTRLNAALLSNFLGALKAASITPKRFMLQTGAKHYGLHLGPTIAPQHETDPRVYLEPNFYYAQEDMLFDYCKEAGVEWNVVRPSMILGAVKEAAMNMVYPLGVFGAIHAHLGRSMAFPGDSGAFQNVVDMSTAKMNGYLEEWAVLSPNTGNEAFNAVDNCPFTVGKFWITFAQWYGVGYEVPDEKTEYKSVQTSYEPPPRGFGPRHAIRYKYTLVEWAMDPEIHAAWKEIMAKYQLESDPFSNVQDCVRIFGFGAAAFLQSYPLILSMDKAHKFGWHGSCDSFESIKQVLDEFADLKMLPPLPGPQPKI